MGRLKLDLHAIYSDGGAIETALAQAMQQAVTKQLEPLYHRLEKDDKNFGRVFVHFRHHS